MSVESEFSIYPAQIYAKSLQNLCKNDTIIYSMRPIH